MRQIRELLSNEAPPANEQALWRHFSETYFSLRIGLAILAFVFPLWLLGWGWLVHDLPLQASMSAYFFAAKATIASGATQCAEFPMRTYLVGGLSAIAAGLYLYKGLTRRENLLLNAAAVCAMLVAFFPERITEKDRKDERVNRLINDCPAVATWIEQQSGLPIHFIAAAALFLFIGIVAKQCAHHSLIYLPSKHWQKKTWFERTYRRIAILFWLFPLFVAVAIRLTGGGSVVFFVEWAGIWVFSLYWGIKTYEMSLSRLEEETGMACETAARNRAAGGAGLPAQRESGVRR